MKKILVSSILYLFTGCAAIQLKPGAERVRFMQSEPKGCKYIGEATGSQGNFFTGGYTSNENLETGARNTLKNKAVELGGNVVVMLTNRAGQTGSFGRFGGSSQQTNVAIAGTIFNCPEIALK